MNFTKAVFVERTGQLILTTDIILLRGEIREPVCFTASVGNMGCAIHVLQRMDLNLTIERE